MTLFFVPFGLFMSHYKLLPLSLTEALAGSLFGYGTLFIINSLFKYVRNIDGIGEGDFDLLLFIGSFTGIIGCWMSITIGSIVGSLFGFLFIILANNNHSKYSIQNIKIPFGPFLALGAIIFVFIQKSIFHYLIY